MSVYLTIASVLTLRSGPSNLWPGHGGEAGETHSTCSTCIIKWRDNTNWLRTTYIHGVEDFLSPFSVQYFSLLVTGWSFTKFHHSSSYHQHQNKFFDLFIKSFAVFTVNITIVSMTLRLVLYTWQLQFSYTVRDILHSETNHPLNRKAYKLKQVFLRNHLFFKASQSLWYWDSICKSKTCLWSNV